MTCHLRYSGFRGAWPTALFQWMLACSVAVPRWKMFSLYLELARAASFLLTDHGSRPLLSRYAQVLTYKYTTKFALKLLSLAFVHRNFECTVADCASHGRTDPRLFQWVCGSTGRPHFTLGGPGSLRRFFLGGGPAGLCVPSRCAGGFYSGVFFGLRLSLSSRFRPSALGAFFSCFSGSAASACVAGTSKSITQDSPKAPMVKVLGLGLQANGFSFRVKGLWLGALLASLVQDV